MVHLSLERQNKPFNFAKSLTHLYPPRFAAVGACRCLSVTFTDTIWQNFLTDMYVVVCLSGFPSVVRLIPRLYRSYPLLRRKYRKSGRSKNLPSLVWDAP